MRLDFFTPTVPSGRGLPQTTTLPKVQARLGVRRTSLGTLSEAADVGDAGLLHAVLSTLGAHLRPPRARAAQEALAPLPAVDGSLVPALPRMAWALGQDAQHRAAKRPVALAGLRPGPVDVTVTAGTASERAEWRRRVQPGGLYGVERGYADDGLLQAMPDWPCRFLCRVQANAAYAVHEERPVSPAAEAAGGRGAAAPLGHGAPDALAAATVPRGAGGHRYAPGRRHAGRLGAGHASAGPGRGVGRPGVSLSVGGSAVLPLGHMCLGRSASAAPRGQRRTHPGVCGPHRESADQSVDRARPHHTYVRKAVVLSDWVGD